MAYPGHGYGGRDEDRDYPPDMDLPPDYDMGPLPHPASRLPQNRHFQGNGRPPEPHYPADESYPRYSLSESGEFDNNVFQVEATSSPRGVHRTMSEGRDQVYHDLDALERQAGRYARENAAFAMDETDHPALHRRYFPNKKSRRKRERERGRRGLQDQSLDDTDNDSVDTITREDLQRAMDFLATIRVRRRQRKSLKRMNSEPSDGQEGGGGEEEEEYEEVVGLPSSRALDKSKTLTERLQEMKGTNEEVAKSLRERYADFDPSLVASAAWKGWEKKKSQLSDIWDQVDIWASHFKEIEGRFGNATASYFRFTRWLIFLNLYTFLVSFLVIVVPFIVATTPEHFLPGLDVSNPQPVVNASPFLNQAINCSATYAVNIENLTKHEATEDKVLDFFIGTGWMERTSMFYGHYHNRTFSDTYNYNMGLAYLMAVGLTFLITFILILINSSSSVKETVVDDKEQSTVHFTNSVMCGWDFCILDEKSAQNKKSILCQEFKADLLEQTKRLQRENRTYRDKLKLVFVRIAVNFVIVCMLGGCIYLIYLTTDSLLDLKEKTSDQLLLLIIQLLPSLTITFINFIIPEIFNVLVSFEDYWPAFQLKITLIRTVFLRLSSLGVLTFTLYYTLLWPKNKGDFYCEEEGTTDNKCCGNFLWAGQKRLVNGTVVEAEDRERSTVQCWETYVGQQFYKLALVDFAALIVITFFVEFPRKFIYNHFKDRIALVGKYGEQEFDIPRNVLDIVYSQTLSWLGSFFAPLLPVMTLLKVFLIFYVKRLTLVKNFAPPQHVYKVSRSNSFFNLILLISFVIVAIIIGYMLGNINPSKGCGPYRVYSKPDYVMWAALTDVISGWPSAASTVFLFFGTTAFFVPCFIVLCLLMYYYWAVGQGYKRRDEILKEQLRLEGKDKHYLLARVNDIIKHGNLRGITSGRY